jgi:hypothetical protein
MNRFIFQISLQLLLLTGFFFLAAVTDTASAQARLHSPVNQALGGGGTAYIDSYQASFINPANLLLNNQQRPSFSIGLLGSTGLTLGGSIINIDAYNNYLTSGHVIRTETANNMLNQWFGENDGNIRSFDVAFDHIPVGVAYRSETWAMALAARSRVMTDVEVNKGMAELVFHGLDSNIFGNGKPVSVNMESLVFSELSLGLALKANSLKNSLGLSEDVNIYIGAAPKILLSHNASKLNFNSVLQVESASNEQNARIYHDFSYRLEATGETAIQLEQYHHDRNTAGTEIKLEDYLDPPARDFYEFQAVGMGIDLGATIEMNTALFQRENTLRLAISLTDLGVVRFDDRSGVFSASGIIDWHGFDHDSEVINQEFDGDSGAYYESVLIDSIGTDTYGNFTPQQGETISRSLPTSIHAGAHFVTGRFGLMMDMGKGFNNRGINSRRLYVALGTEYRLFGFLPIRLGAKTGGFSSMSVHAGTGLEFKNLEFSLSASTVPKSGSYGSAAGVAWSGLVLHF